MAITSDDRRPAPAQRAPIIVPRIIENDRAGVDRRYRAKVVIVMVAGCLAMWGAVGYLLFHAL